MKRVNKKGFTIVELVIVIAVIAILAAVLIPNLSRLVTKANDSADLQNEENAMKNDLLTADGDYANMKADKVVELGGKTYVKSKLAIVKLTKDTSTAENTTYYKTTDNTVATKPTDDNTSVECYVVTADSEVLSGSYDGTVYSVEVRDGVTYSYDVASGKWSH